MGAPNSDSTNEGKPWEEKVLAERVENLKEALKETRQRIDSAEKWVQWVIGLILTIAGVIIGIHSFITYNDAARDREYLFSQLSSKLDETNKVTQAMLIQMMNQQIDVFSNSMEAKIAVDETNLNDQLDLTRDQLMEVGDKIHQKVLLGMAKMFMSMAENLLTYHQYTPVAQCYLGASHACLIGQNYEKLNVCILGLKQALPHMSRRGFVQIPDSTYQLDFLIYTLSLFQDKHYYGDVLVLKAERKRLVGDEYPTSFSPNEDDGYWVKKLQSPTSESSFQKAP